MILIFVESPNKAKAIKEYLKGEKETYKVLATLGHIRNLSRKSGSIKTEEEFSYIWETTPQWEKNKKEIIETAKTANLILIASDPDREGEAIAWHLKEILIANKIKTKIERILFYSISKNSILEAIKNTMVIRQGLVESYLARIGLDYLFGYSISELLWRKVPCCKSAGRVQSASLKLIIERENEIRQFEKRKYITMHSEFDECNSVALLMQNNDKKFENGHIFNEKDVDLETLRKSNFKINKITKQRQKLNPPAPFITSTLQQQASSELNFSPKMTMQYAQKLYEGFSIQGKHVGLITYMRTDSFHIEKEALIKIRNKIVSKFGKKYLSETVVNHKKTVKNAQEAHEAVRPTDIDLEPDNIEFPEANIKKLYTLIWKRTLASQCQCALVDKTSVQIEATKEKNIALFSMTNSIAVFNSFKDIIQEETEEELQEKITKTNILEKLSEGQALTLKDLYIKEHETQPPKRFSEATFISQLEKLGIGRPSTYAKISSVLLEREYIEKQKKIIIPTQKGWIVTAFLESYFQNEIAYQFTSSMEEKLDELASSNDNYIQTLKKFWENLKILIEKSKQTSPLEVSESLEKVFSMYFKAEEAQCACGAKLMLKVSKFGAMRGCSNYPDCKYTVSLAEKSATSEAVAITEKNENIFIKNGPYGQYIQIERDPPKKVPIPKAWLKKADTITAEQALLLAKLPIHLGEYKNKPVKINIGMFGLYVQHEKIFVSISTLDIKLSEAISKIEAKLSKTLKKE